MAARIRIPLREHRPNHLAMQRTLMNNYFFFFFFGGGVLPHGLVVKTSASHDVSTDSNPVAGAPS